MCRINIVSSSSPVQHIRLLIFETLRSLPALGLLSSDRNDLGQAGKIECTKLLLEAGADPSMKIYCRPRNTIDGTTIFFLDLMAATEVSKSLN